MNLIRCLTILMVESAVLKWAWPGHAAIIEAVYNALPEDTKKNLDLAKLKDASNDPDQVFKDTTNHHYPKTYEKATLWLAKAKESYTKKDYEDASYNFGVASHYISDTFSAPHCVSHEKGTDHHKFEIIADNLKPQVSTVSGDLNTLMKSGFEQGQLDWQNWMKNKDNSEAQNEVNQAASVILLAIKDNIS